MRRHARATIMSESFRNRLLAALSPDALAHLTPHLTRVRLEQGQVLYQEGALLTHTYFPETAIVSLVTHLPDGPSIECGAVGCDSAVGFVGAACVNVALRQKVVQLPGDAWMIEADRVRAAVDASPEILHLMLWTSAVFQSNTLQLVACNAHHPIEQRLARWLMQFYDRADGRRFPLTHEFLAQMLGVQRSSLSPAANALQTQALIDYRRGKLEVRYPDLLRAACCPCYENMRRTSERLPRRSQIRCTV